MGDTTTGWAIAMVVVGLLAIGTGLAGGTDASIVVGFVVLGFGVVSFVGLVRRRGPGA